jgi:hypothetical protein
MKSLDHTVLRQWANLIAIIAAFGINVFANIAPVNGLSIGDISNQFFSEVQIIPANYAFAIWGLIYIGLISFGIYQVLPTQRDNPHLRQMGYFLVVASLAQIVWIFLFEYQRFVLSLVAMLVILLPLIAIYWRLRIGEQRVSRQEKWLVHIPLSIYLAWISVATIVNVAIALYSLGWRGEPLSPEIWTVIMILVGGGIAATIARKRVDIAFPLVIIWAFIAIAVRQANQPLIAMTAGGVALGLGLFLLLGWLRRS